MADDMQKMTRKSQEAMQTAAKLAENSRHSVVEPEHLLSELVEQDGGLVPRLLEEAQIKPKAVLTVIAKSFSKMAKLGTAPQQVYASNRLQKIFKEAEDEAKKNQDELISTEHFLLAMMRSNDSELRLLSPTFLSQRQLRLVNSS